MTTNENQLIEQAKQILQQNLRGEFTVPRDKLYPFQWNWDSGFVSIGFANYDITAAINEINSLLKGQWENGMIPHIIFHSETEKTYFPNWDFWDTKVNHGASQSPKTSGISQPPVLGFVLENLLNKHPDNTQIIDFVKYAFPKIVKYHDFWYKYRDAEKEGLVFIFHPWESGRDNSPIWDDALNLIDLKNANLPEYKRRDVTIAEASERPTSTQYDQYVYLLSLGKKHGYDGKGIAEESEFLIQDSLINAVLIRSNEALINIGKRFGFDTKQLEEWQQQSVKAFNDKLWNEDLANYTGYDLRQQKAFPYWEIGGLTALFANIPNAHQAEKMKNNLNDLIQNDFLIVPSFDVNHPLYDSKRYWRGPIWPQMNWMIYHGLKQYQFENEANTVKNNLLELVEKFGFHEYFEAQRHLVETTNGGYGGDNFSWTASSVIDLILCP
jgi:hypothetical protein